MTAYGAVDVLAIELGAAAKNYSSEEEYLKGILKYVSSIESDPLDFLESWNLEEEIDQEQFEEKVMKVKQQIEKTIDTPLSDRGTII